MSSVHFTPNTILQLLKNLDGASSMEADGINPRLLKNEFNFHTILPTHSSSLEILYHYTYIQKMIPVHSYELLPVSLTSV